MFEFKDIFNDVAGTDFEEIPVDIETFVTSPEYLDMGETPLSEYQYQMIRAASQIYTEDTLIALYGEEEGKRKFKRETKQEIIVQWGKGSGKDMTSTVACAYVTYLLLCLKDPARYYHKPPGDSIDIINVAINAAQANNVFFKNFKKRINDAPWFEGKYDDGRAGEISFDKNITVYSGHSEREAFEGYNLFFCVLDEISGFAMNSTSGNANAKTAQSVYDMYRASVTSRFPENGKLVLLSFPRYKGDFISTRYDKVVVDKEVVVREHKFKLDKDLEDGIPENEFTIQWEEDHIVSYNTPGVWALKRPSWEVNPTKNIDNYMRDFYENPTDALGRFACMPPSAVDGFFRDEAKIDRAMLGMNAVVPSTGVYVPGYKPDPRKTYYVHVDLAQKHDRCAVSVAHVDRWTVVEDGGSSVQASPVVHVDLIRYWTPSKDKTVDFAEVRSFLIDLPKRGYNIGKITFDNWNSLDMINYLRAMGLRAETLSVGNPEYYDLAAVISEERLRMPNDPVLRSELLALRIMPNTGKIDHPRTGGKDVSDAVTGSVYNAIANTKRNAGDKVEVVTLADLKRGEIEEQQQSQVAGPIRNPNAPPPKAAPEMRDFLIELRLI